MGSFGVVVFPPLFDQDSCFSQAVEDFAVKQFVSEPCVEALAVSVLPERPWFDAGRPGADGADSVLDGLGNEHGAIVRSDAGGHAVEDKQIAGRGDCAGGFEPSLDLDRRGFPVELVEDVQRAECLAAVGPAMHDVLAPDVVPILRPKPGARPVVQPEPAFLRLFRWHFQPIPPP